MNKNEKLILLLIFLIALLLRFAPILMFGMPLSYDSNYHIKISQHIVETGFIPTIDPDNSLVPYTYPPFYHLIISSLSVFTGLNVWLLVLIFLPLISSLTVISFFLLFRQFVGNYDAFIGVCLIAFMPTLVTAAFDSPENVVFFLFPFVLLLSFRKKWFFSTLFFALNFFWNYLAFIMFSVPFVLAFLREKKFWKHFIPIMLIVLAFWYFAFTGSELSAKGTLSGADFVAVNLADALLGMIIKVGILVLPVLIYAFFNLKGLQMVYWFIYSIVSFFALSSLYLGSALRPWEQPKFLAIGTVSLVAFVKKTDWFNKLIFFFAILLFFAGLNVSFASIFPKVTQNDLIAINWLEEQQPKGLILAEPGFSESLGIYSNTLGKKTLTGLPLESFTDESSVKGLSFLQIHYLSDQNKQFLHDSKIQFLFLNFEDTAFRRPYYEFTNAFNKVYNLSYYANCPFQIFGYWGILCGDVETRILESNYLETD